MSLRVSTIALGVKFGPKLASIGAKLLQSAKATKLGLAGASMASYSWLLSWEFALVILLSLVVHEYGHVRAMRAIGIPTKGFYLIPFFGGAAVPERAFQSRNEEQFVAIAGPVFGFAQAVFFYALFEATQHPLAAALAAWVALLNLINLLPISPLDGGRILKSVTFSMGSRAGNFFVGAVLLAASGAMIALKSWALGIIVFLAFLELLWMRHTCAYSYTPNMSFRQSLSCLALYLLTAAGLVLVLYGCARIPEAALALELLRD